MKARLRLIRHGEAVTAFEGDNDPGLSIKGIRQALALPSVVADKPEKLITSPLIRARETALPLAAACGLERRVEHDYGELPWREGQNAVERIKELSSALEASWSDFDQQWRGWRERLIERALSETGDIVIVSHYVAINVLVGFALSDDRAVIIRPANASITEFHVTAEGLKVVALDREVSAPPDVHLSLTEGSSR